MRETALAVAPDGSSACSIDALAWSLRTGSAAQKVTASAAAQAAVAEECPHAASRSCWD